jgi:branched-chain amino acid transport system permease protein
MPVVRLSEVNLEYFESGHGPQTIVLVHGFQSSASIWAGVQKRLPADRWRTIAINNRGAGASDAPPEERDFTVQKFAADVAELTTRLGIERFHLVGHSMGGATVAQFAVDHPSRVSKLVLLDPASPNGAPMSDAEIDALLDQRMADRRARIEQGDVTHGLDGRGDGGEPQAYAQMLRDVAAAPERRLRGSMRSMLQLRLGEKVGALPMPVLLIAGDQDAVIPLDNMLASWAMYPRGTGLQVWHGVGHCPNLQCPVELATLLDTFLG